MREFKSLRPPGLPVDFDAKIHGEEPIIQLDESHGRIRIDYTFPGFYLSDERREVAGQKLSFKRISIQSSGVRMESGKPLLPTIGRYVQIPFNCEHSFTVHPGESVEFGDILVSPAQARLTDSPDSSVEFEFDKSTYASKVPYPSDLVSVGGPYEIDGYLALVVHVSPFQYVPAQRVLHGYGKITVIIDIVPRETEAAAYPNSDPIENAEAFGNLFLNPKRNIAARLSVTPKVGMVPFWPLPEGPELLIIHADAFSDEAQKLATWKNERGLLTETIPVSAIGNTVVAIKNYIRYRRRIHFRGKHFFYPRLRYVLLFGDVNTIESEMTQGILTDYYYSTPDDAAFAGDLKYPWLSVGRIPVLFAADADCVVDQIIEYEKNPPADPDYYERMTFSAYFEDTGDSEPASAADGRATREFIKTMEAIRERMTNPTLGYDVERVYVAQYDNPAVEEYIDGAPVSQEVKDAIISGPDATQLLKDATAQGRLIIAHRGHGDHDGWLDPSFNSGDLSEPAKVIPSIFYSVCCYTGCFDRLNDVECFAEALLALKGGAPSLIAATHLPNTNLGNSLITAMFDGMWGGLISSCSTPTASYTIRHSRLGDLLRYARSYLPCDMIGNVIAIQQHFENYHVIGDPTLELWRSEPRRLQISARVVNYWSYASAKLQITLSYCPRDSVLTIWHDEKLLKRIEPRSTLICLPLGSLVVPSTNRSRRRVPPKPIRVCFKAPDYRFREVHARI